MTSIPYPSFVYHRPVDKTTTTRNALIAVGRCRIDPTLFIDTTTTTTSNNSTAAAGAAAGGSDDAINNNNNNNNKRPTSMMMAAASSWHEEYRNVVSLAMKHANVEFDSTLVDDETKKKTRKRYMKECVSAAKKYLMEKLQLDVSIIDVEIVVKAEDIIKTDGCLASCLLDAGCCRIVIEYNPTITTTITTTTDASGGGGGADTEKNDDIANGGVAVEENNNNTTTANNSSSSSSLSLLLDAFDCAKIPRDRLMGHLSYETYCRNNLSNSKYTMLELLKLDIEKLKPYCASCSVQVSNNNMHMNNGSSNLPPPTIITANLITSIIQCDNDMEIIVQLKPSSIKGFEQEVPKMIKAVSTALRQGVNSSGRPYCNGPGFGGGHGTGCVALQDPTSTVLGLSYASCLKTDREDGLYTTVVCTRNNEALGLVYSSSDSIVAALECGRGVYYSRSRKGLWRKGDTSGHYQTLHRIDVDCDGDALRYTVTQQQPQPCGGGGSTGGGKGNNNNNNNACGVVGNNNNNHNSTDYQPPSFCHLNTMTCWGPPRGLRNLEEVLNDRLRSAPVGSYTKRLFDDPELLKHKLVEEAQELSEAVEKQHVMEELADVLYFALTSTIKHGVCIDDACSELDRRTRKVTRRKGDSKAFRIQAAKEILSDKKNKKNNREVEDNDNNNDDVDDEKKQQQS